MVGGLSVVIHTKHLLQCLTKSNLPINTDSNDDDDDDDDNKESMTTVRNKSRDLLLIPMKSSVCKIQIFPCPVIYLIRILLYPPQTI